MPANINELARVQMWLKACSHVDVRLLVASNECHTRL